MSSRLMRLLLKLYPRATQDRYGDELLQLGSELKAHGDISRVRLIGDMLSGALLLQAARSRQRLVAGAVLVTVGLAIGGTTAGSHQTAPQASRPRLQAHAPNVSVAPGASCFVDATSSCSQSPCTQFTAQRSTNGATARSRTPTAAQPPRTARTRCISYPQTHRDGAAFPRS